MKPIKRLNIAENANVNNNYLDNLEFIGFSEYSILNVLFNDDELKTINWFWKSNKISHLNQVFLFKSLIKHNIKNSIHDEIWIMGMFVCSDGIYRFSPLKRDSDFNYDIFKYLKYNTIQNIAVAASGCPPAAAEFPWIRKLSIKDLINLTKKMYG